MNDDIEEFKGHEYPAHPKLSPWYILEDYILIRCRKGGDPDRVSDRVAVIEKTARVRIDCNSYTVELGGHCRGAEPMREADAWLMGPKGNSYDTEHNDLDRGPFDWANSILNLFH